MNKVHAAWVCLSRMEVTHPDTTWRYAAAYMGGTSQFLVQQVSLGSWHIRAVMPCKVYYVSRWHVAVYLLVTITAGVFCFQDINNYHYE